MLLLLFTSAAAVYDQEWADFAMTDYKYRGSKLFFGTFHRVLRCFILYVVNCLGHLEL